MISVPDSIYVSGSGRKGNQKRNNLTKGVDASATLVDSYADRLSLLLDSQLVKSRPRMKNFRPI